jgi:hypothetical protein
LPAWRYIEPKDLTVPIINVNEKQWKFCTKFVCRQSGKKGLYLLSHFDSEHKDDYTPPGPANESNLASVDVPLGIPAATTRDPTSISSADDDDPIELQGAWCASVSHAADVATAFLVRPDESEPDPDADTDDELVDAADDLPLLIMRPSDSLVVPIVASLPWLDHDPDTAELACLSSLTSVEREMFLQVEQDLFLGSTTQVNRSATHVHRNPPLWPSTMQPFRRLEHCESRFAFWSPGCQSVRKGALI